jgi:beta-glucosidase-like glycosyl hydrolase
LFTAGVDMIMCPRLEGETPDIIYKALKTAMCDGGSDKGAVSKGCAAKCVPMARLDEAVRRVLTLKAESGLLTAPFPLKNSK